MIIIDDHAVVLLPRLNRHLQNDPNHFLPFKATPKIVAASKLRDRAVYAIHGAEAKVRTIRRPRIRFALNLPTTEGIATSLSVVSDEFRKLMRENRSLLSHEMQHQLEIWREGKKVFNIEWDEWGTFHLATFKRGAWERTFEQPTGEPLL